MIQQADGPTTRWNLTQQVCVDVGRLTFGTAFWVRSVGIEHVPAGGGLLVANHPSLLDPILLLVHAPRRVVPLASADHWQVRGVDVFLDTFDAIAVEPGRGAVRALRRAERLIAGGGLVLLFPEGGLSRQALPRRFQPGAAHLALETGCPVIPVAMCGSYEAWPPGRSLPRPRPVTIRYGPPVDLRAARSRPRSADLLRTVAEELRRAVAKLAADATAPRR